MKRINVWLPLMGYDALEHSFAAIGDRGDVLYGNSTHQLLFR